MRIKRTVMRFTFRHKEKNTRKLVVLLKHCQIKIWYGFRKIYSFSAYNSVTLPLSSGEWTEWGSRERIQKKPKQSSAYIRLKRKRPLKHNVDILSFDYICTKIIAGIAINIAGKILFLRNVDMTKKWRTVSIDISKYNDTIRSLIVQRNYAVLNLIFVIYPSSPVVPLKIKNIRLRSYNIIEKEKDIICKNYQKRIDKEMIDLREYLQEADFSCKVNSVVIDNSGIKVSGEICDTDTDFFLLEIPLFCDFAEKEGFVYDRLYSRWAVAVHSETGYALCSHAKYVNQMASTFSFPFPIHKNKKGLGAFKYNLFETDLDKLGISYITINIRINDFLRRKADKNFIPIQYGGKTYYADAEKISQYDRAIMSATKRGIDVSAIILVCPENRSKDKEIGRILEYPEYNSAGVYSMPNITEIEALNLYTATIDFLASRYNRPDNKFGHIHRWIVHNEVDAGWIWTNAGMKTATQFMDIYVKSLRLVYLTVLKYNENAEVIIPLTHFWQTSYNEPSCYPAAVILNLLLIYCQAEGDFRWGIAHHPYPENLINPRSWEDKTATNSMNTEKITFKNLEILDRWIRQPKTFYHNKKRTLLLSEQNPNSLDYSEKSLNEQAACLAYAWKKVMNCEGIDAYIAHRWIDTHFEGGLKTGLRKYPDDKDNPYGCKPSWYLYRDFATEKEEESCLFAKKIIGIQNWSEIINKVSE